MSKDTNFSGQPVYSQILKYIDKNSIKQIARQGKYNHYVKQLDSYTHLVTFLFAVIERYDSIREIILGLLSNANKLGHIGIQYCIKRSTFAEANQRRSSQFFGAVYAELYRSHARFLADSRKLRVKVKKLYIMDSTTISLFSNILKGVGRNRKYGKKKGGIKSHTIILADENVPVLVRYTSAATHDHILLKELDLPIGSYIVFDKGYVDYVQYERLMQAGIFYITKLKENAIYETIEEIDIADDADAGIIKDELILLRKKEIEHKSRRITYWDDKKKKLIVYLTNNIELTAEDVINIYRNRWQIETLFKQLKQNFPLKYFYGDSVNAIESQIWVTMIANFLFTLIQSKIKRQWAFSNLATTIRQILMNYINIYKFLEQPEKEWNNLINNKSPDPDQMIIDFG